VDENTCLPIGSEAQTQTSNDLPRALTESGQQAEVSPSGWPVLGVAINQSAMALLRLFGRRLLNLDSENLVRPRRDLVGSSAVRESDVCASTLGQTQDVPIMTSTLLEPPRVFEAGKPIGQPPIAFGLGDLLLCRRPGAQFICRGLNSASYFPCTKGRCHSKRFARVRRWSALPAHLALESTWLLLLSRSGLLRDVFSSSSPVLQP
jgi:hypothetical protein